MGSDVSVDLNHPRLKVGDACSTGQKVATILGQSTRVTVFTTTDNQLRWQYHENNGDLSDAQLPVLSEFDSLMTEIRVFIPRHTRPEAYVRLGKALFSTLNSRETNSNRSFDAVRLFITQSSTQRARFLYTAFSLAVAVVLIAALFLIRFFWFSQIAIYFYGAIFGAMGAAVSVMQRSKNIELDVRLPDRSIYLQACIRVLLGSVFGLIFVFASKANLIMGRINDDVSAICIFALVAGVSERFIPDLIERLDASASKQQVSS
ncbi:MAG: hypothetical protein WAU57_08640 [Xanthobacteraceae bacterium]